MKHLKTYEALNKGKEVIYTFKTKAKLPTIYSYDIHILQGDPKYDKYKYKGYEGYDGLILSIDTTPGSWYVSTFLDKPYGDTISINGSEWICINKREIVKELRYWLENEYPIWKQTNKYNL